MPPGDAHRLAHRLLGGLVRRHARPEQLARDLPQARIDLRPEVYLSYAYGITLLCAAGALVLTAVAAGARAAGAPIPRELVLALVPVPLLVLLGGHLGARYMPALIASNRARNIDLRLPSAINYTSIMAGAGNTIESIFVSLARQPLYGEIANEAAWIARDMQILGKDSVTALSDAIARSPSRKMQDFLQGAITTLTSGGQLKDYFVAKSEQYLRDNRQDQRRFLDSLSVLAESYVTVVVAGPVFLIVLLSVMLMFGGSGKALLTMGYVMILGLIPMAQIAFAASLKLIMPEG